MQSQNEILDTVLDEIESLILLSLDANHSDGVAYEKGKGPNRGLKLYDQGALLPKNIVEMRPSSAFTTDLTSESEERLYTTDSDYLIAHPSEILGNGKEICVLAEDHMRWTGYQRLNKAPRGVVAFGSVSHWYACHYRDIYMDGSGVYYRRVVPVNAKGNPVRLKSKGIGYANQKMKEHG